MKKGVIELQFNWIFVLIVGAVILSFFIGLVMKQKDFSLARTGAKISTDLETITAGAEVSRGTAQIIDLPPLGIDFMSEDCNSRYSIGGAVKQYRTKIIFAPSRIQGTQVLAWTLDWSVPYRITNFLFMTSTGMRYILVNPAEPLTIWLNRSLPVDMYKETVSLSDLATTPNENNYKVRFVFVNAAPVLPEAFKSMNNKDVSAVNIVSDYPYDSGTATFYTKVSIGDGFQSVGSAPLLGKFSMYGAVFTDDLEMYVCNMRESFRKMHLVTAIYMNRTNILYHSPELAGCQNGYFPAFAPFATISAHSSVLLTQFPLAISLVSEIYSASIELQAANRNLQLASCPEVY